MAYLGEYIEVGWENEPSQRTPVNAYNLGIMEDGIKRLFAYLIAGGGMGSGTDGREVELRSNGEYIQWRYSGEEDWTNLVALADLKGEKGDNYILTEEDIEEIASKVKVATSADKITYDDTETQLGATNVQDAIGQLSEQIEDLEKDMESVESPTDEQVESAVNSYLEKNPIEGGTVANVTDKPYHLQKIGVLYENPEGYDYIAWCPANLKYDKNLKKYVSLVYGSTQHVNGTTALFVAYIDPDTFEATAPVQCFTDDGATALSGSTAFWIEDDVYKMLYTYTDKVTYIFTSTDYGVNWTKGDKVSGFSGSPWGITKLSNGRLICADDQTKKGIYYSDDNGVNWTNVIPTTCGGGYEAEACILELQEGKLIAIARYSMSGIGYNASGASEPAIVSFSEDYGTTWTAWKKSETITNMNASSCTGHVHNGMVDIFACSRWYWHGSYANDDYVNTGKTGAITHYTATVENALLDNFTNMGIVTYANAIGDTSSQDFHSPVMAVNGDDMLLMWFDRIYPFTEEKTSHYFARGSKADLDTAPRDDLSSVVFPYSSAMVDKLLKKQYTELMTKINEIIISGGGTPDTGDDPENPTSYIFEGCIMNLNYLDSSKHDTENMTLTDSINGEVGTFITSNAGTNLVTAFPEVREHGMAYSHLYFPANTLSKYLQDDGCEFTIELAMYRYSSDAYTENMAGVIPINLFHSDGGGGSSLRIESNLPGCFYLKTDGTMGTGTKTTEGTVNMGYSYDGGIPGDLLTHAVAVYKADGTVEAYLNGAYGGRIVCSDFASWGGTNLTRAFSFNIFGKATRIYNRALTADEVLNNYNYELQSIV